MSLNDNKIIDLYSRVLKVKGGIDQLTKTREDIYNKVSLDKRFVEVQPDVTRVLDKLQDSAHQRSVGAYERMLTAIVDDVLAENGKNISFDLKISRGVPSLDISIDNNGNVESIMDGQGGSVANVVSTGLRYIALSRLSNNRKFVVLDEPDCWLSPDKIPPYFNILNKLSKEIGIQSVVVSHHDMESFGDACVVRVTSEDDEVEAENLTDPVWEDKQDGIRKVRLFNYMSHEFTEFDLSPGVTVVCGENNIGKSAIVTALRAVAYNEGSNHMIKHGEDDCCVELFIENDLIVRWTRTAKIKTKGVGAGKARGAAITKYELLTKSGELLHESINGNEVPDWCEAALKLKKINNIDVHISHQKVPLFMISESPSKRADILSMGKESQYLQKMISIHKDDLKRSKTSIKDGESKISEIDKIVKASDGIDDLVSLAKDVLDNVKKIDSFKDFESRLKKTISSIESYSKLSELSLDINVNEHPELKVDCQKLLSTIDAIRKMAFVESVDVDFSLNENPELYDCLSLSKNISKIKLLADSIHTVEDYNAIEIDINDGIVNTDPLIRKIRDIKDIIRTGKGLVSEKKGIDVELKGIEDSIEELIEELGGECPTCGNELTSEHFLEHDNEETDFVKPSSGARI